MPISPDHLIRLQRRPANVRNMCILAHVDHGKTSLSDNLLASNGIISSALQGQIRYLDSRPDEQERGITMESSAISLYFKIGKQQGQAEEYLINLIDSPGHIDFSSEVSTASRLCDGAVVVVDVVEGVCSQTVTVLRQAWVEKLRPILVVNKMDRLVTELKLTPGEAYVHVARLIEQVNAVTGSFFAGQRMEEDLKWRERLERRQERAEKARQSGGQDVADQGDNDEFIEAEDDDLYFAPERNNVVFGSAVDGWGFNISQFAAMYERKLGMNRAKLEKVLWGDFCLDPKTKKVVSGAALVKGRKYKPLFVQLILDNIWAVYECTLNKDVDKVAKIVAALDLKLSERDVRVKDGRSLRTAIFSQWTPLSRAILLSVVECLPSPVQAQKERTEMLLDNTPGHGQAVAANVRDAMTACSQTGPVVAYISKVLTVPARDIPVAGAARATGGRLDLAELRARSQRARELAGGEQAVNVSSPDQEEEKEAEGEKEADKLIGFARVFSGTIRVGSAVTVLGPRYDPHNPDQFTESATVTGLFILMGRDLVPIDEARAGCIVGIGGLDGHVLKSATVVGSAGGPNLASTGFAAPPILRVAVEPVDPTKIPEVERGLELLNIADTCVRLSVEDNGQHILETAGELHLERCVRDLKERFARVDIHVSEPIVPFRETIVDDHQAWHAEDGSDRARGCVTVTVGASLEVTVQVFALSAELTQCLVDHAAVIRDLNRADDKTEALRQRLDELLTAEKVGVVNNVVAFGPRHTGPNLLLDTGSLSARAFAVAPTDHSWYEDSILSAFQLAMARGPLCAEPLEGVGCRIVSVVDHGSHEAGVQGRVISVVREQMRQGVADWSPRLKLATYLCEIQAPADVLGRVYAVVTRRRGRITREEMKEGTPFFTVQASLPVVEAFGFSEEVRKRTSGAANPQLVFAGFQLLDEDPLWVPTTEEELEELGEVADRENVALKYVEAVRRRKGLSTGRKVVDNAERQRTMRRN